MSPNPVIDALTRRLNANADEDPRTPAEIEADAKAERIKFHREHVRNGPKKFSSVTAGQVRRFEERAEKTRVRKLNAKRRRDFFKAQRETLTIASQLRALGLGWPEGQERYAVPETQVRIANALILKYGGIEQAVDRLQALSDYLGSNGAKATA